MCTMDGARRLGGGRAGRGEATEVDPASVATAGRVPPIVQPLVVLTGAPLPSGGANVNVPGVRTTAPVLPDG
jgi:hypothetical protein